MIDADIDTFLKFTRVELKKNDVLLQDEHLRRQSSFYKPVNVDFIVPLESLDSFLTEHLSVNTSGYFNRSIPAKASRVSEKQQYELELLYREDYELLKSMNIYSPGLV